MSKGMRVLAEDCDPSVSDDKSLPTDAFMVEYIVEGLSKFDLVRSGKKVDIFDEYYDKYKKNLINITQAEGRISPKLWNPPGSKKEKEKEKK
tara:strand:+ start:206 stop:481 length:276 start_codon:yes stop_codon:yes gene_type:complete